MKIARVYNFTGIILLAVLMLFLCFNNLNASITQLTDNSYSDSNPQINSSGQVVWRGRDGSDYEIFLYDGTVTKQLTDNSFNDRNPQINDSEQVVWRGHDGSDYEIFLYDGTVTTQLTNNSYDDLDPQINNAGQVVWKGHDGSDSEIFLYDGTVTKQLTDNSFYDYSPQINSSGQVVWYGYNGSDSEIFLYDGTFIIQLTNNSYDDYDPQINSSGQVVWERYDGLVTEIFLYDGTVTKQFADNSYSDYSPQINSSGQVVWVEYDGSGYEIFLYDGTSVTQLTDNAFHDYSPQINSSGQVVWYGYDGSDYEIFLYDTSDISVSPTSHDSGSVNVGSTSTPYTFTVTNIGEADLIIGTLGITGADVSEFSIQNDNCSAQIIAASGTCTVDIVFSPASEGIKSAKLTILSNDPDTPALDVPLSGIGGICTYSISPAGKSLSPDSDTGSVSVTAADDCDWAATSNASWIAITSGSAGSGNGTVNYSVASNTSTSSRTGTMTIAGKTFTVTQSGVGAGPAPNIKANGSDGPVTPTGNLSITVALDPGSRSGDNADWWVAADTPIGWYYFNAGTLEWILAGASYTDLIVTYQGPLFDLATFEVLNMPVSGLPSGTYKFYFAVDMNMNGLLDLDELYYDSIVVNITP